MNKRELAKAVAVHADVDLKTVSTVLEGFTDVVTAVVSQGEPVAITGFAKFVKVNRPARMGRNPATGEAIRIKASKKARITPVKAFKDAVMAPAIAPRLKRGAFPTSDEAVRAAGKAAAPATASCPQGGTGAQDRGQEDDAPSTGQEGTGTPYHRQEGPGSSHRQEDHRPQAVDSPGGLRGAARARRRR